MTRKTKPEIAQHFDDAGNKAFKIRVSPEALSIISKIEDFDLDDFESWWIKNRAMVGGMDLFAYLQFKDRTEGRGA